MHMNMMVADVVVEDENDMNTNMSTRKVVVVVVIKKI
jgi:hypothetical protein